VNQESLQRRCSRIFFPQPPRDPRFGRGVRIALRTAHILTTGVLLGGHVFAVASPALELWLWLSVLSGLLLFATDLHATFVTLFELHGLAVLVKLALLALVPVFWEHRVGLLVVILIIGGVSSHMPGRWRHTLILLRGRFAAYQRPD